ncbi:MAG: c-type cytochrome [Burkholderiales bacterium]|nr:c-type cytochrome [Burkholderiales bacterium]
MRRAAAAALAACLVACLPAPPPAPPQVPLGLPPLAAPADNPPGAEKAALGRKLFFDRRLSANGTMSCAMCHVPEQGFTSNELATALGVEGRSLRRNAPTVLNAAYHPVLFHDGREHALELQVWGPLLAANEMANPSVGHVVARIRALPDYAGLFERAFGGRPAGVETIGQAIASYERTLLSGGSRFDRWRYGGEADALDATEQEGYRLFVGKARCASCHPVGERAALFSDFRFHNTGVGWRRVYGASERVRVELAPGVFTEVERRMLESVFEPPIPDLGRFEITLDPADRWAYKTPMLRDVALTAPYMHDGSIATLEEVVAFYDRGGVDNPGKSPLLAPLGLTAGEKAALVAFLRSLTGGNVAALAKQAREPGASGE